MRLFKAFILVGWVLVAAGCSPDFDEEFLVKDLRILAMRAEPPELLFTELPQAGAIPPIQVDVLAVNPEAPDDDYDWEMWACTPEKGRCRDARTEQMVATGRGPLGQIGFSYIPDPAFLLEALDADVFRGFGGLPVIIEVRINDPERGELVVGAKRLVYTFPLPYSPIPQQKVANSNPVLVEVREETETIVLPLAVETMAETRLFPVPTAETKEKYWVVTTDGDPLAGLPTTGEQELDEFISYAYFTTAGSFSSFRTGGRPNPFVDNKKVDDITTVWTAPEEPGDATIWVVVRDDRGGSDWMMLPATVAAP